MTGVSRHTVCWLIRHGQTTWNRERRYLSRTNLPLNAFGHEQAAAVAWRLRRQPLTAVIHSDLRYTGQTAAAIAARDKAPQIEADRDWREADQGHWEGLTYRELMERYPEEAQARFADPWSVAPAGGETLAGMKGRVLAAWRELLRCHDGGRIAIVTHAGPIQLLLCELLGIATSRCWQLRIDLGSVSGIDLYPSAAIVRFVNEVPSLRPRAIPTVHAPASEVATGRGTDG